MWRYLKGIKLIILFLNSDGKFELYLDPLI